MAEGSPFSAVDGGVTLAVRLAPKASENRIGPVALDDAGGAVLKVAVTEIPEGGKANKALIKLLAKSNLDPCRTALRTPRGMHTR